MVRVGSNVSTAFSLSTGSPQGCVLSPLFYTFYTSDCTPVHSSNTFANFLMTPQCWGPSQGLTRYQDDVEWLTVWYNNLLLKTSKSKELVIKFRKNATVWKGSQTSASWESTLRRT